MSRRSKRFEFWCQGNWKDLKLVIELNKKSQSKNSLCKISTFCSLRRVFFWHRPLARPILSRAVFDAFRFCTWRGYRIGQGGEREKSHGTVQGVEGAKLGRAGQKTWKFHHKWISQILQMAFQWHICSQFHSYSRILKDLCRPRGTGPRLDRWGY